MASLFPRLTTLPIKTFPNIFKYLRSYLIANQIINKYYDNSFNFKQFICGSKEAIGVVSKHLSCGNLGKLNGLVTNDVISEIRYNMPNFTPSQRIELQINPADIFLAFPYSIDVWLIPEDQLKFIEITVSYHVLHELRAQTQSEKFPMEWKKLCKNYFVLNYRFAKEFGKNMGKEDWTINGINHFKPLELYC